ncbi:MAG: zf-HC2 domain-containing protein, partial [Anaerolineales bacterium]
MTALTHAQAHQHLHAAADGQLDAPGQAALAAHLATCAGCRAYAAELDALQISLAHLLHSRWDAPPIPSSLPARVRERASRTGRYRLSLHAAAKLAGVGLALALIALVAGWLNRQPLTPAPDSTLSIRVLGVHDVQAGETVRCIAAAYGISPAALIEANQLGQPPRLRSGSLLIPDAPAEVEAIGPTCAPQFAAPYALDPVAHVAAPPTFAFGLQDDAIEARASNAGCNWMIIAGQVYGRNG